MSGSVSTPRRVVERTECTACGHRSAWLSGVRYTDGQENGRITAGSPERYLPCVSCGGPPGTVSEEVARRMGAAENEGHLTWDCPERVDA